MCEIAGEIVYQVQKRSAELHLRFLTGGAGAPLGRCSYQAPRRPPTVSGSALDLTKTIHCPTLRLRTR